MQINQQFICPACQKSYYRIHDLKIHLKEKHVMRIEEHDDRNEVESIEVQNDSFRGLSTVDTDVVDDSEKLKDDDGSGNLLIGP